MGFEFNCIQAETSQRRHVRVGFGWKPQGAFACAEIRSDWCVILRKFVWTNFGSGGGFPSSSNCHQEPRSVNAIALDVLQISR